MNTTQADIDLAGRLNQDLSAVRKEISRIIVGQEKTIDHLLVSLLSRGHCLLVGVPGLAKTLLIKTLANVLDLGFNRIQFTPDLMPSDIIGTELIEEDQLTRKREFRFIPGPVFANVILADEINRTPPKTQAALLEAMQEHKATIAGKTYSLPEPFFVLATQNPIEQEGTYPLPEAQLDRFMFNLWLEYPAKDEEKEIVRTTTAGAAPVLNRVVNAATLTQYQDIVRRIPVADNVIDYAVSFVGKTRPGSADAPKVVTDMVRWGAGPRASQYLILAAKARAVMTGRFTPGIEDVQAVVEPVLRHRIITNFSAEAEGVSSVDIIRKLMQV